MEALPHLYLYLYLGDLLVLECVDRIACRGLRDALVLPVLGPRPHADESSGGDLDGDQFFVSWEPGLIPPSSNLQSAPLYAAARSLASAEASQLQLARYFASFDNRLLGRMNNWYLRWADLAGPGCDQVRRYPGGRPALAGLTAHYHSPPIHHSPSATALSDARCLLCFPAVLRPGCAVYTGRGCCEYWRQGCSARATQAARWSTPAGRQGGHLHVESPHALAVLLLAIMICRSL